MRVKSYLQNKMGAMLERAGIIKPQRAAIFSVWEIEHYRPNPVTGELDLLSTEKVHNLVTNQGLDDILDAYFTSGDQKTTWYVAIFDDDYTVLATNTYQSKGFSESTDYDESTRPTWSGGTVSGQSVDNSASKATFTMNATTDIYGAALVGGEDADTKNDSSAGSTPPNIMYCSAQFSAMKSVVDDDVLKVTVTLTASSV
jgi:hypothetical protein